MKRLLLIPILCLGLMSLWSQQWQGVAAYGNSSDFPTQGYYAASSSFPVNSIITVRNLETGKTVRVVVSRELKDPGIFLTLSPDAARDIGLEAGRTLQVSARQYYMYDLSDSSPVEDYPAVARANTDIAPPQTTTPPATPSPAPNVNRESQNLRAQTATQDLPLPTEVPSTSGVPGFVQAATTNQTAHMGQDPEIDTLVRTRALPGTRGNASGQEIVANAAKTAEPSATPAVKQLGLLETNSIGSTIANAPSAKEALGSKKANASPEPKYVVNGSDVPLPADKGSLMPPNLADRTPEVAELPLLETSKDAQLAGSFPLARDAFPTPSPGAAPAVTVDPLMTQTGLAAGMDKLRKDSASIASTEGVGQTGSKASGKGMASGIQSLKTRSADKTDSAKVAAVPEKTPVPTASPAPSTPSTPTASPSSVLSAGKNVGSKTGKKNTGKVISAPTPSPAPVVEIPAATLAAPSASPEVIGSGMVAGIRGMNHSSTDDRPNPGDVARPDSLLDTSLAGNASQDKVSVAPAQPKLKTKDGVPVWASTWDENADAAMEGLLGPDQSGVGVSALPEADLHGPETSVALSPAQNTDVGGIALDSSKVSRWIPGDPALKGSSATTNDDVTLGTLPESRLPGLPNADVSFKGSAAGKESDATLSFLPESRLPGQANADAALKGTAADKESDASLSALPESRLPGQASADAALKGTAAGKESDASLSGLPETRIPGKPALDASLAGAPGAKESETTLSDLPQTKLPGLSAADASLKGSAAPGALNPELASLDGARDPAKFPADSGIDGADPENKGLDAQLTLAKQKELVRPDSTSSSPIPPDSVISLAPTDNKPPVLKNPVNDGLLVPGKKADPALSVNLPGVTGKNLPGADKGIAPASKTEVSPDTKLASPEKPQGPESSAVLASPGPDTSAPVSLAQAQLLKSLGQADSSLKTAGTDEKALAAQLYRAQDPGKLVDPSIATAEAAKEGAVSTSAKEPLVAEKTAKSVATVPADKVPADKTSSDAVQKAPEDKAPAKTSTEKTSPPDLALVPSGDKKPQADLAKSGDASFLLVEKLEADSWYLQLGAFNSIETARKALKNTKTGYPYVILTEKVKGKKVFKVYLGPILEDEKGMLLYTFRAKGYKDAFVRKGKEEAK